MSAMGRIWQRCLAMLRRSADDQLRWQMGRQTEVAHLRHEQALAEQALVADLQKRAQQLEHELQLNATRQATELQILKTQCQRDLQDYQDYLNALDQLKVSLRASYAHLPEAVAFTIHHHAKQLLNRLWDAHDSQEKLLAERQLIQLMTAVHEDSRLALTDAVSNALPQKTLAMIEDSR